MITETVLIALASGGSAVAAAGITAHINRRNTKDQIRSQQKRLETRLEANKNQKLAEFYADNKVECLSELHSTAEKLHLEFTEQYPFGFGSTDVEKLRQLKREFESQGRKSKIYLDNEGYKKVINLMNDYRDLIESLENNPPSLNMSMREASDFIDEIRDKIEDEDNDSPDFDELDDDEITSVIEMYEKLSSEENEMVDQIADDILEHTVTLQQVLEDELAKPIKKFES